jgi:undecaprenyl diphosphate synthase
MTAIPDRTERLPKHVVLIPDGNGRWAKQRGKPVLEGHRRGAQAVQAFLAVCRDWGIPVATVWAFSTENWSRDPREVKGVMQLVEAYLRKNRKRFSQDGVRFQHVGNSEDLQSRNPRLFELLGVIKEETVKNEPFTLNLALDYGGRDEVVRAIKRLISTGLNPEEVTWECLAGMLDTAGQPDPDLIIRTSGEQRLSGILPLQAVYAEINFVETLLPDMGEEEFRQAIRAFESRERRFGGRPTTGALQSTSE